MCICVWEQQRCGERAPRLTNAMATLLRRQLHPLAACCTAGLALSLRRVAEAEEEPEKSRRPITREELAAHNKSGDHWIAINGNVYDVSRYTRQHPGGRAALMQYAGKDATGAFSVLHPPEVLSQVASKYQIGVLEPEAQHLAKAAEASPRVEPSLGGRQSDDAIALQAASQTLDAVSGVRELLKRQQDDAPFAPAAAAPAKPPAQAFAAPPTMAGSASARSMEAERLDVAALGLLPNLASIQAVAERLMPSALRLYIGYGAEDEETVASNRSAWSGYSLRPRILTAAGPPSTSCQVLGCTLDSPVVIAPFAGARACHPEGEAAIARATGGRGSGFVVPHFGGTPLSPTIRARTRARAQSSCPPHPRLSTSSHPTFCVHPLRPPHFYVHPILPPHFCVPPPTPLLCAALRRHAHRGGGRAAYLLTYVLTYLRRHAHRGSERGILRGI